MTTKKAASRTQRKYGELIIETFLRLVLYGFAANHFIWSAYESKKNSWISILGVVLQVFLALLSARAFVLEIVFGLERFLKLPPGRMGFPILGDIPLIILYYRGDATKYWADRREQYGTVQMCHVVSPIVNLMDAPSLQWLWSNDRKNLTQVKWPAVISQLAGKHAMINSVGQHHKRLRRIMEPFFTPVFVKKYFQNIVDISQKELTKWSSSGQFQSSNVFKLFTLRVLFTVALGSVNEDIIMKIHDQFAIWLNGFLSLVGATRIPGLAFDKGMKARECILGYMQEMIDEFKAKYDENSELSKSTIMGQMIYSRDKDGNCLSMDEIKDNMLTLMFAGHDTTFAAISSCLYYISEYPKAREALLNEISSFRSPLDHDEIRQAPVLNAIMYEVLRIDPPVAAVYRQANQAVDYDSFSFSKGSLFVYHIRGTLQDDDMYSDPESFHFERFLPKDHPLYDASWASKVDASNGRGAYPVFGGGPRVCLGQYFAKMEVLVMLTLMFKNHLVEMGRSEKVTVPVNLWAVDFKLKRKE